jgi:hypothetical protein
VATYYTAGVNMMLRWVAHTDRVITNTKNMRFFALRMPLEILALSDSIVLSVTYA